MNLKPLASNMTELELEDKFIMFSYQTPVVVIFKNSDEVWKTCARWSNTTSRHIKKYLFQTGKESLATFVDQQYISDLVK